MKDEQKQDYLGGGFRGTMIFFLYDCDGIGYSGGVFDNCLEQSFIDECTNKQKYEKVDNFLASKHFITGRGTLKWYRIETGNNYSQFMKIPDFERLYIKCLYGDKEELERYKENCDVISLMFINDILDGNYNKEKVGQSNQDRINVGDKVIVNVDSFSNPPIFKAGDIGVVTSVSRTPSGTEYKVKSETKGDSLFEYFRNNEVTKVKQL